MSGRSPKGARTTEPSQSVDLDGGVECGGFSATLTEVALPMGLILDSVKLSGGRTAMTANPFGIAPDEPGLMVVELGETSLTKFLNAQAPGGLKDFQVELSEGKIAVSATLKMIFEIRARAICRVTVKDERRLYIELETLDVQSGPKGLAPKNLVQAQLDRINPIVDMDSLPVLARIHTVEIDEGKIRLSGEVSPRT